jgi:YegS/Rv2252/BmrU family lipid kinase
VKTVFILNGISLHKKKFLRHFSGDVLRELNAELWETQSKHDGQRLAAQAAGKGAQLIVAVGGDGTLHQVLNGILEDQDIPAERLPILAVLPLGSGNDYARTLGMPLFPEQWRSLLENRTVKLADVGRIQYSDSEKRPTYFLNEADVGMGPEVVRRVSSGDRIFGSAVAYYVAILRTFLSYQPQEVQARTKDWQWQGVIRTVAIMKGKFFGNGLGIAPDAVIDDGFFRSFICGGVSVWDFIRFSQTLKQCRKIPHLHVHYQSLTSIELSSPADLAIEADGELVGKLPVTIDLLPSRIRVLVPTI